MGGETMTDEEDLAKVRQYIHHEELTEDEFMDMFPVEFGFKYNEYYKEDYSNYFEREFRRFRVGIFGELP